MIYYNHEGLIVIEFTGFSRGLSSLNYYKGQGLNILLQPSLYNSNNTSGLTLKSQKTCQNAVCKHTAMAKRIQTPIT